jgi:hypothetical protein
VDESLLHKNRRNFAKENMSAVRSGSPGLISQGAAIRTPPFPDHPMERGVCTNEPFLEFLWWDGNLRTLPVVHFFPSFPHPFFGALRHVKRVYDVHQHIFSDEGEYVLDMHHIFSQHVVLREALRLGSIKELLRRC